MQVGRHPGYPATSPARPAAFPQRKHLVADRFKRVWALVEHIAQRPGHSRDELAAQFALSRRQLQADITLIRNELGLPLSRVRGYRFEPPPTEGSADLTLRDLLTLALIVQRAREDPAVPAESLAHITAKLPLAFPPPLQPLARRTLNPPPDDDLTPGPEVFTTLAESLVSRQTVRLQYPPRARVRYLTHPLVDPQILMPYDGGWYLIGYCHQRNRDMLFPLNIVQSVTITE